MTHEQAINIAETIKLFEAKKQNIEDFIDNLKDKLKAYLTEQGETTMLLGSTKVSWTEYETTRFDTKTFKGEHQDLYHQYEVKSNVKRFTIR